MEINEAPTGEAPRTCPRVGGRRNVRAQIFFLYINISRNIYVYLYTSHMRQKQKIGRGNEQQVGWPEAVGTSDGLCFGLANQCLLP
jgi:hypothetical protein